MQKEQQASLERAMEIIREIDFPTLPLYLQLIQKEMRQPEPSFGKISNFISEDIALTAKVLKVANSPAYCSKYRIDNIPQALTTLGLSNLYTAVLEDAIKKELNSHHLSHQNFAVIWKHSTDIAYASQHIAKLLNGYSELGISIDENYAYLTGLFHDCGIPIMASRYANYEISMNRCAEEHGSLMGAESVSYLTDHSVVCYLVAKRWELPIPVQNAIFCHHSVDLGYYTNVQDRQLSLILRVAESFFAEISGDNTHIFTDDAFTLGELMPLLEEEFEIEEELVEELYASLEELIQEVAK